MTIRSTDGSGSTLYSSSSELEWAETQLVACLYMLGFNESDLPTITIDEIVQKCKYMYEPHDSSPQLSGYLPNSYIPSELEGRLYESGYSFGRKQKSLLMMVVRRLWRRYQIAKHEVETNV